jgi:hypothetical protein
MTDKTREAFEAQYASGDAFSDAISLARRDDGEYEQALARMCYKWFCKGQAATSAADARYMPVIEKLVGAGDRASCWMYSEIKAKVDSNEDNYNSFVQLREALALAAPLLAEKRDV